MTTYNVSTLVSALLITSENQYQAALENNLEGNFQPAVLSARKAAETIVHSIGKSDNLRAELHKVPETPLVMAAWEKSFWKLHPRQQRYELLFARTNAVLEKRAREITSTFYLLGKSGEAYAKHEFSNAACITLEATRRAANNSPEQKRAAFMWSIYARDLDPYRRNTELFMAQKIPALAPYIDKVASLEAPSVNTKRCHTLNNGYQSGPVRRLGARLLALADKYIPLG